MLERERVLQKMLPEQRRLLKRFCRLFRDYLTGERFSVYYVSSIPVLVRFGELYAALFNKELLKISLINSFLRTRPLK